MYLDSLRFFLHIVEEKSISKAAQRVHVSQSAMSQLIHKLEEDLGYELLNRSNKGVTVTARGEIAHKYIQKIIRNYDQMLADLNEFENEMKQITIMGTRSLSAYSLPCMPMPCPPACPTRSRACAFFCAVPGVAATYAPLSG